MLTKDLQRIDQLRDVPDLVPVVRNYYQPWTLRVFRRNEHACRNYLSPNRRDFYKVLLITAGTGVFTLGSQVYRIEQPTILFLAPGEIISWQNLSACGAGYYCLFKPLLFAGHRPMLDAYALFSDRTRSVLHVPSTAVPILTHLFEQLYQEQQPGQPLSEDASRAYLQLLQVESLRMAQFGQPEHAPESIRHLYSFFELLEAQIAQLNETQSIGLRSAKEFAAALGVHPNHLNALLKKHTGQPVSSHIRHRLLDEAKALLVQTNWPLHSIAYSLGFAETTNFHTFFKKNTGLTPAAFRHTAP